MKAGIQHHSYFAYCYWGEIGYNTLHSITITKDTGETGTSVFIRRVPNRAVKDGGYFGYCAYVLRISGWSEKIGFLNGGAC